MPESLQSGEPTAPDAHETPETNALSADAPVQESQVADSSTAVNDTDEIAQKAKGVGKRIDELTRNWREAERREAALLDLLKQGQSAQPVQQAEQPKTLADFEYDEAKYQAHLFQTVETRAIAAAKRELQQQAQRETHTRRTQSFQQREADFSKSVDDYTEVAHNPDLRISPAMAEAIADSEEGPALAYHLGKNPEMAERIASLPPIAAARELGRIEARLAAEREKAKAPVVSKAPPPAPKIDAGSASPSVSTTDPESDRLSDDEWFKAEKKRLARKK